MVTKQELISRANKWCNRRYGEKATLRSIMNWVEKELVPPPIRKGLGRGKGSESQWDKQAYRSICKIARLKSLGIGDFDRIRILLWISGQYCNSKRLRISCLKELQRLRRSHVFKPRTNVDPSLGAITKRNLQTFSNAAGQLDSRIVPQGFSYSQANTAQMFAFIKQEHQSPEFARTLINSFGFTQSGLVDRLLNELRGLSGLLAEPDESENSGQSTVENSSTKDFQLARVQVWFVAAQLRILAAKHPNADVATVLTHLAKALNQPDFKVSIFLEFLQLAKTPPSQPELKSPSTIAEAVRMLDFLSKFTYVELEAQISKIHIAK